MGVLARLGFRTRRPPNWNKWWVRMWLIVTPALLTYAFFTPFWPWWALAALIGFGLPEAISLLRKDDAYPPLTHTMRHFLPNWLAFPLIYGLLAAIGGRWFGFAYPRYWTIGALFAVLGWLTDHFAVTYGRPDPYPFGTSDAAPARGLPPVIQQQRPA